MKAAYIKELGPPDNIIFGDMPVPVIGASRTLVKVVAVAVDPIDTYIRRGAFPMNLRSRSSSDATWWALSIQSVAT